VSFFDECRCGRSLAASVPFAKIEEVLSADRIVM